jgi:hypothetical protein
MPVKVPFALNRQLLSARIDFCASFGPPPCPSICAIRSRPFPDFCPDQSRAYPPRRIKRLLISSRLRSRRFPPSESQFLLFVRLMCTKYSSRRQSKLRDERSVWARRCKPRERQLRLPRSLARRKKSHRSAGNGILSRQACDKRSHTSFINYEYESIKFDIGRGRRGRMKATGRCFIQLVDRLRLEVKSRQRFLS